MNDPIPETVAEALALWNSGQSVFTIEMGGIGPGYEQAIQILAFEIMREFVGEDWSVLWDEHHKADTSGRRDAVVRRLDRRFGFSGAQVGAATSLASYVLTRGYRAALRDPAVKDRLIQVSKRMPEAP